MDSDGEMVAKRTLLIMEPFTDAATAEALL